MTIRNVVPRFGIRWAVVLAAVAAVVVAALLAVGSPASAQSTDGEEIWSGTVTVGLHSSAQGAPRGYFNLASSDDYGSLDDNKFTFDGTTYTISIINDTAGFNGSQGIGIAPIPSEQEAKAWTLHMSGRTYSLGASLDAGDTTDEPGLRYYQFRNEGRIGWSDNDEVVVKITALPIISIEAVTTTVEYGGNNNAAASTAEFRFTRTGSTDEALSFDLLNHSSGEIATRTFKAGVSSFSNFYWAIDVDESNAPVCYIAWVIQPGDHYIDGSTTTNNGAEVDVEGPGTTCMGTM